MVKQDLEILEDLLNYVKSLNKQVGATVNTPCTEVSKEYYNSAVNAAKLQVIGDLSGIIEKHLNK